MLVTKECTHTNQYEIPNRQPRTVPRSSLFCENAQFCARSPSAQAHSETDSPDHRPSVRVRQLAWLPKSVSPVYLGRPPLDKAEKGSSFRILVFPTSTFPLRRLENSDSSDWRRLWKVPTDLSERSA